MNKKLKRICLISNDYPSKGLPIYVFVEQLVKTLVDFGTDVSVLAPQSITKSLIRHIPIRPCKQWCVTDKGNGYFVYRPYNLTFGNKKRWLYQLAIGYNRWAVKKCLQEIAPDILYAHFWNNAIRIMYYAMKEEKPVFVACGEGDNALEEMMATLSAHEKQTLVNAVKGVICVSTENKRKCIDYGLAKEENIIVLPNAVDTRLFHPREKNNMLRKELGVEDDDFLILFVGGFIPRKGSGILAKSIDRIGDSHVKVIYIGAMMPGDEDDPQCDGIVFKGRVPHDKLPDYYASADVFVLPTQKEGCSNAIVEALAMGLPIISSKGAFNDDILNEDNSIRVNPTDVDELSAAITLLRDDVAYRKRLSEGALKSASLLKIELRAEEIVKFIMRQIES